MTQRTSCNTVHYQPIPTSPSHFTERPQTFPQTSVFPTFKSPSSLRPDPFLYFIIHLSPKFLTLKPVKPGKELLLAPSPAPLQEGKSTPQSSPELGCNTSSKRCSSRRWTTLSQTQKLHPRNYSKSCVIVSASGSLI